MTHVHAWKDRQKTASGCQVRECRRCGLVTVRCTDEHLAIRYPEYERRPGFDGLFKKAQP